jgi:hypothetical protein
VMRGGHVQWYDARSHATAAEIGGPSGLKVTAIASRHDGKSIVLAASKARVSACRTLLELQTIKRTDFLTESELPHVRWLAGRVDAMAVTADRGKLAIAERVAEETGGDCERTQLVVVDVRTGEKRVWTLPYAEAADNGNAGYGGYFLRNLAWAPDGRQLALQYGQCCANGGGTWILDTQRSGGRLIPALKRVHTQVCPGDAYDWTAAGLIGDDSGTGCGGRTTRVTAINPVTGASAVLSRAAIPGGPVSQISSDPTGGHLLVYADQHVYRIDGDTLTKLIALPWNPDEPPQAVW